MPRLDNSHPGAVELGVSWTPEDPGATPPVDLCYLCWRDTVAVMGLSHLEIDHPDYEDGDYTCFLCSAALRSYDNEAL